MANDLKYRNILYDTSIQLGPYPEEKLKRVDAPTTRIVGEIERRDYREMALAKGVRGDYGEKVAEGGKRFTVCEPIGASLVSMQKHLNEMRDNQIAAQKAPLPDNPLAVTRHIKSLGYFLGADMVGVCKLPKSAVYSHDMEGNEISADYKYAIVFIARKDEKTSNASCGYDWIFDPLSFAVYQKLACQTEVTANYIRRLGYKADPSNMYTYLTLMPQLVLEAGLGETSRMGIILNPFLGGNFKSAAVLTDLDLVPDKYVDFGLQDYCERCSICADQCPAGAISKGKKEIFNGYETWRMDERKCTTFDYLNKKGCVCGRCTKICPWHVTDGNKPEDFKDWDGSIEWLHKRADRQAAWLKENDYTDPRESTHKWWFDFERIDGVLTIPKTSELL